MLATTTTAQHGQLALGPNASMGRLSPVPVAPASSIVASSLTQPTASISTSGYNVSLQPSARAVPAHAQALPVATVSKMAPTPVARRGPVPGMVMPSSNGQSVQTMYHPTVVSADGGIQAEIARRQAAEARVRELEALVLRLRQRITTLEGGTSERGHGKEKKKHEPVPLENDDADSQIDDPIDAAICEYLNRNPDFPVSIQKVAPNYYVFGDRGTVYVTQRGEHIVVRVGGGFKSLQVFMDERALMVTRDAASALSAQRDAEA